jgi:hypothetical protein
MLAEIEVRRRFLVATDDPAAQLREQGVVLLRDAFSKDSLTWLKDAAIRCFEAIGSALALPDHYLYSRSSNSVLLTALIDFGCGDEKELLKPLSMLGLEQLFSESLGSAWTCVLEQSWVRKKHAPALAPASGYHPQNWHQDGALGVRFPLEPGSLTPMTALMTCWIPLQDCGLDSPGLEFICRRLPGLLHFTELDDSALRQRFPPQDFWAPALKFGDGLVFLDSVLHRTSLRPEMRHDRMSVDYRIFPA